MISDSDFGPYKSTYSFNEEVWGSLAEGISSLNPFKYFSTHVAGLLVITLLLSLFLYFLGISGHQCTEERKYFELSILLRKIGALFEWIRDALQLHCP